MAGSVRFGTGAADELPAVLENDGCGTVLLVTDSGVREAGLIDPILDGFERIEVDYAVFDDVEPDPSLSVFESAVSTAAEYGPDAIVGVGGGSSMDVAKVTSVIAPHEGTIMDYVAQPTGGGKPLPGSGLTNICLPTTAGTGSETSPVSVISLPDRDLKVGISSDELRPDTAIVDPSMTLSLPPYPTAASGIDALSHAIEAYVTRRFDAKSPPDHPDDRPDYGGRTVLTDALALRAIRLISGSLRDAVNNGRDLEARRNMALGSLLAGVAFTNAGLGLAHAMAMATGARHHTAHGATIAAVFPAVMRFNATSSFDRFAELARIMGENTDGRSQDEAAELAARAVEKLVEDVGLSGRLSPLGIEESDVEPLSENAKQLERLVVGNPRRVSDAEMRSLFERSL